MIVLARPCPGPPLFVAYIKEEPPLFDMHQGYLLFEYLNEDNYVVIAVRIHR